MHASCGPGPASDSTTAILSKKPWVHKTLSAPAKKKAPAGAFLVQSGYYSKLIFTALLRRVTSPIPFTISRSSISVKSPYSSR